MCDTSVKLEKLIPCRLEGVRRLFKSFAKQPPRSLEFLNRLPEIEQLAQTRPGEASRLLNVLMRELKSVEDGMGGKILNNERFEKFIICHDDTYPEAAPSKTVPSGG